MVPPSVYKKQLKKYNWEYLVMEEDCLRSVVRRFEGVE